MKKILSSFKIFLEKIDKFRNRSLHVFILRYWPRKITPNHLTIARVVIGFVIFFILFYFKNSNRIIIFLLFSLGILTDFIDGPVARTLKKETAFGAVLDSTADRILLTPIAIYSLYSNYLALLIILALTEINNALFSLYFKSKEIYLEADIYGKTKMVLFCIGFSAFFLFLPNTPPKIFIYILWLTIVFSLLSLFLKISEFKKRSHV